MKKLATIKTKILMLFFIASTASADILEEIEGKFIEIHEKVGRSVVNIERESQISAVAVDREGIV